MDGFVLMVRYPPSDPARRKRLFHALGQHLFGGVPFVGVGPGDHDVGDESSPGMPRRPRSLPATATRLEAFLAGFWLGVCDAVRGLKRRGECYPVCLFMDNASRGSRRLCHALWPSEPPPEGGPRPTLAVCTNADARRALHATLGLGGLLRDPRGADPDGGFWLVLVRGRKLRAGLATLRGGQPVLLRQTSVSLG